MVSCHETFKHKFTMKNYIYVLLLGVITLAPSCKLVPRTLGEARSGYTYVPIDPFSVTVAPSMTANASSATLEGTNALTLPGTNVVALARINVTSLPGTNGVTSASTELLTLSNTELLESLPDNAVRISVEEFGASGKVTYGPAAISVKGSTYKVTIDYINADTTSIRVFMAKSVMVREDKSVFQHIWSFFTGKSLAGAERKFVHMNAPLPDGAVRGSEHYAVQRVDVRSLDTNRIVASGMTNIGEVVRYGANFNIPVYIGIGLRVTANVASYEGNVDIAGLGSIGAAADAKKISGSLVVQTLGINGRGVASALPIQSELNQSTVQAAIVAIGSIKSNLYDSDTALAARVVGLYLPFPADKPLVSAIISEISSDPVKWCRISK